MASETFGVWCSCPGRPELDEWMTLEGERFEAPLEAAANVAMASRMVPTPLHWNYEVREIPR